MFGTGDRVGRFQVLAKLGSGGMGDIFLVTAPDAIRTNNLFALKLLKEELTSDPEIVHMFLREAELAARLSHS